MIKFWVCEKLVLLIHLYVYLYKYADHFFSQDVANLIPDVHGQNLEEIKYTGMLIFVWFS